MRVVRVLYLRVVRVLYLRVVRVLYLRVVRVPCVLIILCSVSSSLQSACSLLTMSPSTQTNSGHFP